MRWIGMLTGELLRSFSWHDEETIELAQAATMALLNLGLARDAVLVWLDQVCTHPARFLDDPLLAPLAAAWLDQQPRVLQVNGAAKRVASQ
jgi:hypothetical protein